MSPLESNTEPADDLDEPEYNPSFGYSVTVILMLVAVLIIGLVVISLPSNVTIFSAYLVALALVIPITRSYKSAQNCAFNAIRQAHEAIFILLGVGALLGTWMISGTIPTLIDLGLKSISPEYFLITTLLLCSIVSVATGTAFGSIGTVGLALIVVASGIGVPLGPTAAAIVCGAIFGDKLSPLSDTTNVAAAITRTNLIVHIRHMLWTTIPAYLITAVFFLFLDLRRADSRAELDEAEAMIATIEGNFDVSIINLVPALVVIGLLVFRMPAFPALILGAVAAFPFSILIQNASFSETMVALFDGPIISTGDPIVDDLLSGGGIVEIVGSVVVLVMVAVAIGGLLGGAGVLQAVIGRLSSVTKTARRVVLSTLGITLLTNMVTASQTTSIVATGTLMLPTFKKHNLHSKNLSRALEDAGSMTGFVIPWNTAAIFAVGVLGVSVGAYAPYALFSFLTPLISAFFAITGLTIVRTRYQPDASKETADRKESK